MAEDIYVSGSSWRLGCVTTIDIYAYGEVHTCVYYRIQFYLRYTIAAAALAPHVTDELITLLHHCSRSQPLPECGYEIW